MCECSSDCKFGGMEGMLTEMAKLCWANAAPMITWADWTDKSRPCQSRATTEIGLCALHYKEIVTGA